MMTTFIGLTCANTKSFLAILCTYYFAYAISAAVHSSYIVSCHYALNSMKTKINFIIDSHVVLRLHGAD